MRPPSILDVVRAVKVASRRRRDVRAWWYAPAKRLRLDGELAAGGVGQPPLEIVIDPVAGRTPDCDQIARDISSVLGAASVHVRARDGGGTADGLYRLVSRTDDPDFDEGRDGDDARSEASDGGRRG